MYTRVNPILLYKSLVKGGVHYTDMFAWWLLFGAVVQKSFIFVSFVRVP